MRYIYNLVTIETFCEKTDLTTLSRTIEAMKIHAGMTSVSSVALPKPGCGFYQMNWQEIVLLLRYILAYADVQIVLYTLEENGVHAMCTKIDAEFYAADEKKWYSEHFFVRNRELETNFTRDYKSCQHTCHEQFPVHGEKDHKCQFLEHYLLLQPK